jgi:hypothetical protein
MSTALWPCCFRSFTRAQSSPAIAGVLAETKTAAIIIVVVVRIVHLRKPS